MPVGHVSLFFFRIAFFLLKRNPADEKSILRTFESA